MKARMRRKRIARALREFYKPLGRFGRKHRKIVAKNLYQWDHMERERKRATKNKRRA